MIRSEGPTSLPDHALFDSLDQGHAFALPVTGPHHDNLGRRSGLFNLKAGRIVGRKQRAARNRKRRERESKWKLGFQGVAEYRSGRAYRKSGVLAQESLFLR